MKTLLRRHRGAVALFVTSAVFLAGGSLILRAMANPETIVFPSDGHLALDYISGNRAYSVWHTKKDPVGMKVTFRNDGSKVFPLAPSFPLTEQPTGPHLVAQYDLRNEGAYDFQITGLAAGDTATLVRENDFIWVIPAMLAGVLAFLSFIGGLFAVFVVNRRAGRS